MLSLLAVRDVRRERGGNVWRGASEGGRGSQRSSCYQYELMQVLQYVMLLFPLLRKLETQGPYGYTSHIQVLFTPVILGVP